MYEKTFGDKSLLFSKRVADIALFEWKENEQTASCLVIGENEEAKALTMILETRCREADRIPVPQKTYDIIFLTDAYDIHQLKGIADRETLVVDASVSKAVRYFDPTLPFRQVRIVSLAEENTKYGQNRYQKYELVQDLQ